MELKNVVMDFIEKMATLYVIQVVAPLNSREKGRPRKTKLQPGDRQCTQKKTCTQFYS